MSGTSGVDEFLTPYETICWADETILELNRLIERYLAQARHCVDVDHDSTENVHKIVLGGPIPNSIRRKLMEALAHIRNSFDQSTFAAVTAVLGSSPKGSIYFPWADSRCDLDYRLGAKSRKSPKHPKIPPSLWPVLRSFEPYPTGNDYAGGNDLVRQMAKIANRKHTVALRLVASTSGHRFRINYTGSAGAAKIGYSSWDPVDNQLIFSRLPMDADYDYHGQIALKIAFDEPGFLLQKPVVDSLCIFSAKAKTVADTLQRECHHLMPL